MTREEIEALDPPLEVGQYRFIKTAYHDCMALFHDDGKHFRYSIFLCDETFGVEDLIFVGPPIPIEDYAPGVEDD